MIDTILDVVFYVLKAIIGLLPTYTPSNTGYIQSLLNVLATFNNYFPAVELAECIIAYLAFVALVLLVRPILKFGRLA